MEVNGEVNGEVNPDGFSRPNDKSWFSGPRTKTRAIQADSEAKPGMAEPAGRRLIQRLAIAAQKRNGVALDPSALACLAGLFVSDVQPQKRHGTDMATDSRFEFRLRQPAGRPPLDTDPVEPAPLRRLAWTFPGWRQIDAVLLRQRPADEPAEYRAPMVPVAGARRAAMLCQPLP